MVKAIIFALYRTIFLRDPKKERELDIAIVKKLRSLGFDVYLKEFTTSKDFFLRFYKRTGRVQNDLELSRKIIEGLGVDLDDDALEEHIVPLFSKYKGLIKFYPDALKVIKGLSKDYKLGIIANGGFYAVHNARKFELEKYFQSIVISSVVGARKPRKEIFQIALKELGVPAKDAVMVGDDIEDDIFGGERVGLKTILLLRGPKELETLTGVKPDFTIKSLTELPQIIKKLDKKR